MFDSAILAAIGDKDAKIRVETVRAMAARHVVSATPSLLKAAEDAEADVRHESLRALGVGCPAMPWRRWPQCSCGPPTMGPVAKRPTPGERRHARSGH